MKPGRITPLILTLDEKDNIERCLERLDWAERIVVIDSGSTDATLEICASHPNVEVFHQPFVSLAEQANFGLENITTDWVLSIDADYLVPVTFTEDLERLRKIDDLAGVWARFQYCVFGRPLQSSLYPPRLVLYRRKLARYRQDGHAHRVEVAGRKANLDAAFDHDDRKPIARWFASQARYAHQEANKLQQVDSEESIPDRLRRMIIPAPILVFFWCLLVKRCLFDGWRGWYYTFQRVTAEVMLSVALLDHKLRPRRSIFDET